MLKYKFITKQHDKEGSKYVLTKPTTTEPQQRKKLSGKLLHWKDSSVYLRGTTSDCRCTCI